ncbi:MAG: NAD(P)/FAD-dependent oxidoreductase [Candidatus Nanopelagicales bacterium]
MAHTDSLWWDTLPADLRGPTRPPLTADTSVDVAIVGAGYTGLWTAYYLLCQQPDLRLVVVDAIVAGFGASGRNGGWCSALLPTALPTIAKQSSRDAAIAWQRQMFDTVKEVGAVAAAEGIECDFRLGGTVQLARSAPQLSRAQDEVADARSWGFTDADVRFLDQTQARAETNATDVLGGVFNAHCACLHPARLVRGLALAVERLGATIYEHTAAQTVAPGIVETSRGRIRAEHVILATEGYTATIAGHHRDVVPVYSLVLATEPLSPALWNDLGLHSRQTFADLRHLIIYGQRTADDRIVFGGRGAPYHVGSQVKPEFDTNTRVHAELQRTLVELFPALADARITHRWGGPLGIARDWWPSVRYDRATGFGQAGGYVGDGVATSNLAGRTLADVVLNRSSDLTRLPWVGHRSRRWEPEPLRWLGINAGLQAMTSADNAEQRTGKSASRAEWMGSLMGGH